MTDQSLTEDLKRERDDLEKADQDLREGAERITKQQLLIERLGAQGHETDQAEALLLNLEQMLEAWLAHRALIIERIALLEHSSDLGGAS